jgi:very-short-patch-repair endonuclease
VISEGEDDGRADAVGDLESVLSLLLGRGAPERMLRWHYRSRHASLIAVSNHEFYADRLVVFPSPGTDAVARGLRLRHLPETAYEPGTSRTNPAEARAVAEAVLRHTVESPDLSLGVVAFSVAQRDAIELQLEALRRADPRGEDFFGELGEERPEPFFVKNLENVQGDERDVIFISVGYGKTRDGHLPHRFGPLNAEGGERRLNVLISRARLAMDVFANFTADDLDLERAPARGVAALKTFLAYAASGRLELPHPTGEESDSPFEEAVGRALRERGVPVDVQVGTAGFFIDLAVRDAERPGRYLLGIECDGATYHSARSARDRDRLRQAVLEGLGWRLHRVWSADWYRNPARETERVLAAIRHAAEAAAAESVGEARGSEPEGESPVAGGGEAPEGRDGQAASPGSAMARDGPAEPAHPGDTGDKSAAAGSEAADSREGDARERGNAVTAVTAVGNGAAAAPRAGPAGTPYVTACLRLHLVGRALHDLPAAELAEHIREIVEVEGPVHASVAARRLTEGAGLERTGSRIRAATERAIEDGVRRGVIDRRGPFLWAPGMTDPPVRDRSALDAAERKLEWIAPEEIAASLVEEIRVSFSLEPRDAVQRAARRLGLARTSEQARQVFEAALEGLLARGDLVWRDTRVAMGPDSAGPSGGRDDE